MAEGAGFLAQLVAVITKSDLAAVVEFDEAAARRNIEAVRPGMEILKCRQKRARECTNTWSFWPFGARGRERLPRCEFRVTSPRRPDSRSLRPTRGCWLSLRYPRCELCLAQESPQSHFLRHRLRRELPGAAASWLPTLFARWDWRCLAPRYLARTRVPARTSRDILSPD